ncbi:glycosyltransferase family 2 protein [Lacisediminihabitans sp. H27-G8]|uniref:glycosyltransferase family 2 protein n=1 Tax=Lacisediminihabitans sp. H27-G8 TaxID=3111909 RepID=UPI0038FC144D
MTTPTTLTVVILTYRRPQELARALPDILEQVVRTNDSPDGPDCRVLVVDNDANGGARFVVDELGSELVDYVVEPEPGIAAARNRGLDECHGRDLLVYIDDDESPRDAWLSSLIETWRAFPATAVMGRVVSVFDEAPDPWVEAGQFFRRPNMPSGTEVEVAATGNLLLDLNRLRVHRVRFDNRFGLTGGEDTLFSRQLVEAGGRIVWCNESEATDFVPASRASRSWVLRRARRSSNTRTTIDLYVAKTGAERLAVRARALVGGPVRIATGTLRFAAGLAIRSLHHQARGLRLANRGIGMIAAATGTVYEEYRRHD